MSFNKSFLKSYENNELHNLDKVSIKLTNDCNLRCEKCDVWRSKDDIIYWKYEDIIKVINELCFLKVKRIIFTGGEVTMHPHIAQLILFCNNLKIKTTIITNGYNISEQLIENILLSGLRQMIVSLDSHIDQIHNKMVGKKAFNRTVNTIVRALDIIQSNDLKTKLLINCVVFKNNFSHLDDYVLFLAKIGVKEIRFLELHDVDFSMDKLRLNRSDEYFFDTIVRPKIDKIAKVNNITIWYNLSFDFNPINHLTGLNLNLNNLYKHIPCLVPWHNIKINLNGEVQPCCLIKTKIGNVNKSSIIDIINNSSYKQFRKYSKPPINRRQCKNCTYKIDYNLEKYIELID